MKTRRFRLVALALVVTTVVVLWREISHSEGPEFVRIREVQGRAHRSPLDRKRVERVRGVVSAVRRKGFYIEDPSPDEELATSEAVFVFTSESPSVKVGQHVDVRGRVVEYYPGGRDTGNLSTTQIENPTVEILTSPAQLPPPFVMRTVARDPSQVVIPTRVVENDAKGKEVDGSSSVRFDPLEDALDFFESLEGMRVRVEGAVVVGARDKNREIVVLPNAADSRKLRTSRGGLLRGETAIHPERLIISNAIVRRAPVVDVGDEIEAFDAVVDYSYGHFKLINLEPLRVRRRGLERESSQFGGDEKSKRLTVASYNVLNLNQGAAPRIERLARQIVEALGAPDIVALQEMQDDNGPHDDAVVSGEQTFERLVAMIKKVGGPRYEFRQLDPEDDQDGGQPGANIRNGYLFRSGRVAFEESFGDPVFSKSQLSGKSFAEAGRFASGSDAFSQTRKPLVAAFRFRNRTVVLINVHLSSRYGSPPNFGRVQPAPDPTQPARTKQVREILELVKRASRSRQRRACRRARRLERLRARRAAPRRLG